MEKVLKVKDLYITFNTLSGKLHAVRNINFDLHKGETLAIVGESGSGKSVTTKAIMGILAQNANIESGEIIYGERDILKLTEDEMVKLRGSEIAMIFQDPMSSLDPIMKIGSQIMEAMRFKDRVDRKEAERRALELMKAVGIPDAEKRFNQYPFQFSGGMRQRIVIAIALASEPKVLICDEPTTALDVTIQAQILDLIKDIQKTRDLSVIFITHDLGVVASIADRVIVMYAGEAIEGGHIHEIFYKPQNPYTWALLSSIPDLDTDVTERLYAIPGAPPNMVFPPKGDAFAARNKYALNVDFKLNPKVVSVSKTHWAKTWLLDKRAPVTEMPEILKKRLNNENDTINKPSIQGWSSSTKDKRKPLLQVKELEQHFTSGFGRKKLVVKAVNGISFDIYEGETFGLVGESGCGKTTTGRSIIRLYEPSGGEVLFNGKPISKKLSKEEKLEVTSGIQMIFQDPIASLNPRMTVKEIIAEGLKINKLCDDEAEIEKRVIEMLETVGLNREHSTRYPHEFSGGQRQRIGIARALVTKPKLIIADEPISALDVSIQAQILNLLNDIKEKFNLTILFIAHDLSVVKYFSDRIGVMHKGKIVEMTHSSRLYANPIHPYTKSLLSAIPIPDPRKEDLRTRTQCEALDYGKPGQQMIDIGNDHYVFGTREEVMKYME